MNQNVRFQTLNTEVSVFKLEVDKPQPFHFYKSHTITIDGVETVVYACEIGEKTVDCCHGDYIVIGTNTIYRNGECKIIEDIRVMTEEVLIKRIQAFDELQEEFVNIEDVFNETADYDKEPTDEDLQLIGAELEELLKDWNVINEDEDDDC